MDDTKFIETHEEGNFGIAVWTNKLIYWDSNSMPNAEFSKNYEDNKKSFLYKQYELENNMNIHMCNLQRKSIMILKNSAADPDPPRV